MTTPDDKRLQDQVNAANNAGAVEPAHWVGERPTSLHGNGAASFARGSGDEDEVTCKLCLSLLANPDVRVNANLDTPPDSRSEVETLAEAPCICASSFGHWHREDVERVVAARERAAEARALRAAADEMWRIFLRLPHTPSPVGDYVQRRVIEFRDRADRIEGDR